MMRSTGPISDGALAAVTADRILLAGCDLTEGVDMITKAILVRALELHRGNLCHASRALGRHRNTLHRLLERYELLDLPQKIRGANRQRKLRFEQGIELVEGRRRSVA